MSSTTPKSPSRIKRLSTNVFAQLLVAIALGIILGAVFPEFGASLQPLGTGFIKLIKMIIAPLVFVLVTIGIARMNDLAKLGRIGIKTLAYFTAVTSLALLIGLAMGNIFRPGHGFHIPAETLSDGAEQLSERSKGESLPGAVEFLLGIIPDSAVGAFADAEILQVLLLAILTGVTLAKMRAQNPLNLTSRLLEEAEEILFTIMGWIMRLAPLGAFGAMSYIIGQYGLASLRNFAALIAVCYGSAVLFVIILAIIARTFAGIRIWGFIKASREEFGLALGTASTEAVMPRIMQKLVVAGNKEGTVGLVVPTGYSFNMDGATLYLAICMMFLAQATGTDLTLDQQLVAMLILLLSSKGMAGVPGSSFLALSASATALGLFPVAAVAILLGADRLMDSMRVFVNLLGNCVATFVISRWEREFNMDEYQDFIDGKRTIADIVDAQSKEAASTPTAPIAAKSTL
ncbi:MAG: cation:dicarboxylase symporter family transporter [Corynebacterium sp.]|nr:cation:dicarboxylase symporter family transporter [Corynebacterium sp.]